MLVAIEKNHVRWARGVMRWLLLGVLLSSTPRAQAQDCPYSDDEAVADTLDPAGYYPLEIGTVREYVNRTGAFLGTLRREEVVADTLIEDVLFKKLKVISFDAEHTTIITEADTSYSYRSVVEGVSLRWTAHGGITALTPLFHDFNTCYDIGVEQNAGVVEGGYLTTFTFEDGDSIDLAATKEFAFFGIATEEYGHGLGLLHSGGDPDVRTDLTFVRIDGQEYGTPLDSLFDIRVATEAPPAGPTTRLDIYPNPARTSAHFALELTHPGRAAVRIYDVRGRLVATPAQETYLSAGTHTVAWNAERVVPGVYVARLTVEGHPAAHARLVVVH